MPKIIISLLLSFLFLNSFSQGVRYNIADGAIGIQTPHDWKFYAHNETKIFSHPFDYNLRIYGITNQIGYTWVNGDRASFRSGGQITFWGFSDNNYHYYRLIPIASTIYPFDRNYLGMDLQTLFNPYNLTVEIGFAMVIRIK